MLTVGEVELLYDDYCWECQAEGIVPKPIAQWWADECC